MNSFMLYQLNFEKKMFVPRKINQKRVKKNIE